MACVTAEADEGVLRETSETPPSHYVLKLESFSLFSSNGVDQIKSNTFQVGDHNWRIIVFPNGNNRGKDDHVSMYLMLDSKSSLPSGKGVNAFFKFFLFDQIRGNYLTVQGRARRFDRLKSEWGLDKLIPLEAFNDPSNGFLVNDTSFFGVEVFVTEGPYLGECRSLSKVANISGKFKWVINHFSDLGEEHFSDEFVVGGHKWKLCLYPEGNAKHKGFSMSIFLVAVDCKSSLNEHDVKAEFALTLTDQIKQNYIQKKTSTWFGASNPDRGFASFVELKDLKDDKKGYIVANGCIIEAEVTVLCEGSLETLEC